MFIAKNKKFIVVFLIITIAVSYLFLTGKTKKSELAVSFEIGKYESGNSEDHFTKKNEKQENTSVISVDNNDKVNVAVTELSKDDINDDLFTKIVSDENVVDGVYLASIMTSNHFKSVVDNLSSYKEKSVDTIKFEDSLYGFVNQLSYNSHFVDYKVACNNEICFGYFLSPSEDDVIKFSNDFSVSNSSPMNKSGYINQLMQKDKNTDLYECRVSFNSDPLINSITVPK